MIAATCNYPIRSKEGIARHARAEHVRHHGDHTSQCVPRKTARGVICGPFRGVVKYRRLGTQFEIEVLKEMV